MQTKTTTASTFGALADLLAYPTDGYAYAVSGCVSHLGKTNEKASLEVEGFASAIADMPLASLEEIYTRTFDMAPVCVPYVTTYIWGDESFERGKLMSGLADAYARLGFATNGELPDHIALMLKFVGFLDEAETVDLIEYCLKKPVKEMTERLESAGNLYAPVLRAVAAVIERDFPEDKSHD